jgi:hypothetical protein
VNLLDADAVSKLAHWDLLDELAPLTGIPVAQTATLSSLVHRAEKSCEKADGKLFQSTAAASRAHSYLKHLPKLPAPAEDVLSLLQHVAGIDAGESVLLATLAPRPDALLITGDKRALTALFRAASPALLNALAGRIVSIEQVVFALLEAKGIEWLREHICPFRTLDKTIGAVMGSSCQASIESVREGLLSYIADLRSKTGGLLRTSPPFD